MPIAAEQSQNQWLHLGFTQQTQQIQVAEPMLF